MNAIILQRRHFPSRIYPQPPQECRSLIYKCLLGLRTSPSSFMVKPRSLRVSPPTFMVKPSSLWKHIASSRISLHLSGRLGGVFNIARDERGNVESALTLIPLMLLFLSVLQICISVYSRDTYSQITQGAVAFSAMGDGASQSWSSNPIALPLPGGGSVLVGQREQSVPTVTPLLPSGDSFNTTGIAVQE